MLVTKSGAFTCKIEKFFDKLVWTSVHASVCATHTLIIITAIGY